MLSMVTFDEKFADWTASNARAVGIGSGACSLRSR